MLFREVVLFGSDNLAALITYGLYSDFFNVKVIGTYRPT
jgi:hypothetical protein